MQRNSSDEQSTSKNDNITSKSTYRFLKNQFSNGYNGLHQLFNSNDVARATGLFFTNLVGVVSATYLMDVMYTLKTTGNARAYRPSFIFPYFVANWRALLKGYGNTYIQASAKNAVLSNTSHIHG